MASKITVNDFIHNDLKQFSNADNVRSIPSIKDGFKDSQRKVIFGMTLFGNTEEKVSRLSSKIAVECNYSHGETSLSGTIVGLAQCFPGSNNINLLEPLGQFGTRLSPEAASERYISTKKSLYFDKILRNEDKILLRYKQDEGIEVEPENYFPIIPLWLVNGTDGIGTGYMSSIYPRNPQMIANLIKNYGAMSDDEINQALTPWFRDWKGCVNTIELGKYEFVGCFERVNTTTIKVTELPVGVTVDKYKQVLIDLLDRQIIRDYDNNSKETGFEFVLTVPREFTKYDDQKIVQILKLSAKGSDVVTLWNIHDKMYRYPSVKEAFFEFVKWREMQFTEFKKQRLQMYLDDIKALQNKADFISAWIATKSSGLSESLVIDEIMKVTDLEKDQILSFMNIPVRALTVEKIKELQDEISREEKRMSTLKNKSIREIYLDSIKFLLI